MKLLDLLEQGKKATHDSFLDVSCGEYLISNSRESCIMVILKDGSGQLYNLTIEELADKNWHEYIEPKHQANFEFDNKDEYYHIGVGYIDKITYGNNWADADLLKAFSAFPNKELAEYIQKKQLLERKLMVFSCLNGSDKIDWKDGQPKFFIDYYGDFGIDTINIKRKIQSHVNSNDDIRYKEAYKVFFYSYEVAGKALELYKEDIEEVLERSLKFGF